MCECKCILAPKRQKPKEIVVCYVKCLNVQAKIKVFEKEVQTAQAKIEAFEKKYQTAQAKINISHQKVKNTSGKSMFLHADRRPAADRPAGHRTSESQDNQRKA